MNAENLEIGTCIKNADKKVLFQDSLCLKVCGDMRGEACHKGCMSNYVSISGMTLIKNSEVENRLVDAVVINNGESLTTLIYPCIIDEEKQMAEVEKLIAYGLSKSEVAIFSMVMLGQKNEQIRKTLFISKPTLKTHLNNIYKKLPDSYQQYKSRR